MLTWFRRSGALPGAAIAIGLFLLSLALASPPSLEGVDAEIVRQVAERDFTGHATWFAARLAAFAAAFGMLVGVWSRWVAGRNHIGYLATFGTALLALGARATAQYPQLFSDSLYGRGGIFAWTQARITDLPHPLWALLPIGILSLHGLRARPPRLWQGGAVAAAFVLPIWIQATPPSAPVGRPNVLILAADSLRPDFIDARRTPNLAGLVQAGTHWPDTFVHTPRTFPSWAEFLSGRFSPSTGIRHMFPAAEERRFTGLSLLEHYRRNGYRTFAVADYAGDVFPRFDAAFDTVVAPTFNFRMIVEEQIVRTQPWLFGALTWSWARELFPVLREFADLADPAWLTADLSRLLPARSGEQPFFGVAFYSVTHFPYAVPFPYYSAETASGYLGPYKYGKPAAIVDGGLSAADRAQVRGLYAGGVRAFDREVGEVLGLLRVRGLGRNTILVILADHGENLYERDGDIGHGDHLRGNESLRIPFIVYDPTRRLTPGKREGLVQSVDVLPTLMQIAGLDSPPGLDGYGLASTTTPTRETVFAETGMWLAATSEKLLENRRIAYPDILQLGTVDTLADDQIVLQRAARPLVLAAKHRMAFDGRFKIIYAPTRQGVHWEAVDVERDPLETAPFAIPAPGEWPARRTGDGARLYELQRRLVSHAVSTGASVSSGGWLMPQDGKWAP